jgi:hypothetical protein
MGKFEIKEKLDNTLYSIYNVFSEVLFHLNPVIKKKLKENLAYKNKHIGERCFILGTGPSLNLLSKVQIDKLSKEIVFGVNSVYKADIVSPIVPKYYALLDNLYWGEWSHTFADVANRYSHQPPIFITDLRARSFSEKASIANQSLYVYSKKYPTNKISEKLDSNIFAAMNVISYSILAAMYMGFKDIYLLGCDYNAFCTAGKGHAYDDKSELKQSNYNLAFYLKFYWITTEFHYLIAKLAKEKGVNVVNLTPNSLLDAYQRFSIDDIFVDA